MINDIILYAETIKDEMATKREPDEVEGSGRVRRSVKRGLVIIPHSICRGDRPVAPTRGHDIGRGVLHTSLHCKFDL